MAGIARFHRSLVCGENGIEFHKLSGCLGTVIVMGGSISEIARIFRTHREKGVSVRAYLLWAVVSGLILVHATSMRSVVFTVLMISQIVGCVLIATTATIYGVP